jgi:beta-lactamase regulating signal transducer with metallopeptidase domain/predicted  nucleic acid-binding Zn-ribbon protein
MTGFTWLVALTLRSTVVLAVALGLGRLLRRSSAGARHRLLTLTALGLLALPALPWLLPSLELPFALPRVAFATASPPVLPVDRDLVASPAERGRPAGFVPLVAEEQVLALAAPSGIAAWGAAFGTTALIVWLIGVLGTLSGLVRALVRESRLLSASRPLGGPWRDTLDEVRGALSLTRPVRLLTCEEVETPLTGGWPWPAVLVPPSASSWSEERRRLVVQHELVHVMRGDALRHLAWRLVSALYWFHPLARFAERQAQLAGEHACDETVVGLGTRPSTYARHLLEIAEGLRAPSPAFASALPMVERSQLERRVVMILESQPYAVRGRAAAVACLSLLTGTILAVAAAAFGRTAPAPTPAAAAPVAATEPARRTPARSACRDEVGGDFSANGTHDGDFSLQHYLGDKQRLCARVEGPVQFDEQTGAIRQLPAGSSVLIETREREASSQRMLVTEEKGEPRYQWWLNDTSRPVDDNARAWLRDALEVVSAFRAIGSLQGEVGSLQGEIGSIQGEIGSLQGEIGSLQGEEGNLQGKIGSIQGEVGSLEGEIGSHQGAIGGLQAARSEASGPLRQQIDAEIQQHEAAIRKLEARKDEGALSRRLSEAEAELRAFQKASRGQIAELERKIEAIRSEDGIGKLERRIQDLHADDRISTIKRRVDPTVERLKERIRNLGG